jgi:hypothetical protein
MPSVILSGADYLALPRDQETWLVKPLLPRSGAMILYGDPKIGKSFAALQLAGALQGGSSWLDFQIPQPCKVVYVQLDTPQGVWIERLTALQLTGFETGPLLLADRKTLDTWPFDILNPSHLSLLQTSLAACSPDAVIIDTLRESHSLDENDSTTMKRVVSSLVAATQPAALILIHHTKKPSLGVEPDLINDLRGGYIAGRMDAIVKFTSHACYYVGRSIEQGSIHLTRLDSGLWAVDQGDFDFLLHAIVADTSLSGIGEKAAALATQTGKSLEACKSALRRHS